MITACEYGCYSHLCYCYTCLLIVILLLKKVKTFTLRLNFDIRKLFGWTYHRSRPSVQYQFARHSTTTAVVARGKMAKSAWLKWEENNLLYEELTRDRRLEELSVTGGGKGMIHAIKIAEVCLPR